MLRSLRPPVLDKDRNVGNGRMFHGRDLRLSCKEAASAISQGNKKPGRKGRVSDFSS